MFFIIEPEVSDFFFLITRPDEKLITINVYDSYFEILKHISSKNQDSVNLGLKSKNYNIMGKKKLCFTFKAK